jgi:microcystin-dependent protein
MSVNVYDPVNDKLIPVAGATLYADTPIGAIQAFDAEEVPDGWLIFNGQTVLRSDYPDLWARANRNGQVGEGKFYGIGDGSTTFTLADLRETSLKGYGETSRAVGAHVKSGGLAVGEFIDDRIKEHTHYGNYGSVGSGVVGAVPTNGTVYNSAIGTTSTGSATTEVKAVGVVWAVKAKQVGLPIDLQQQISKQNSYSTSEINTGKKWIDGKPIYRKVIDCGVLPNATSKSIATGLVNLSTVISIKGIANTAGAGTCLPIPYVSIDSDDTSLQIACYFQSGNVYIRTFMDLTIYIKSYITIEYTKTTD